MNYTKVYMDIITQLPETIQILIALSPFFALMISLGYLLKVGFSKAKKYAIFWLIFSILFGAFYIHGLLNDQLSELNIFRGFIVMIGSFNTYWSMQMGKKTKKKR